METSFLQPLGSTPRYVVQAVAVLPLLPLLAPTAVISPRSKLLEARDMSRPARHSSQPQLVSNKSWGWSVDHCRIENHDFGDPFLETLSCFFYVFQQDMFQPKKSNWKYDSKNAKYWFHVWTRGCLITVQQINKLVFTRKKRGFNLQNGGFCQHMDWLKRWSAGNSQSLRSNIAFCCWQISPWTIGLKVDGHRGSDANQETNMEGPKFLFPIFLMFCPTKQSSSPNPFWDMGFHVNLEVDPTLGCFTAGSRGPTSFVPLVIEASVVSGDRWNQVPTMQQVKISQAMRKNFTGLLMFRGYHWNIDMARNSGNLKLMFAKQTSKRYWKTNYGRHVQNRTRWTFFSSICRKLMGFDHVKTSVPLCRALASTACWVSLAMARAHLEDSLASVRYWKCLW